MKTISNNKSGVKPAPVQYDPDAKRTTSTSKK